MITLNFENPNSRNLTEIAIYREEVGVEIPDPPINPPVGIVNGFSTSFDDNTTVEGTDYNYRVRVFKQGGESILSDNIVLGDVSLYGPGSTTIATSGTETVYLLGLVDHSELFPSTDYLLSIAGPDSGLIGWENKWLKFRIGSDIYFTPYRTYVSVSTDSFESFMSQMSINATITCDYMNYRFGGNDIADADALAIFDGCTPTKYNLTKEYPRVNICKAASRAPVAANLEVKVVWAVSDSQNGKAFGVTKVIPHINCNSSYIYMNTFYNNEWYWKPILKFVPRSVRNYP